MVSVRSYGGAENSQEVVMAREDIALRIPMFALCFAALKKLHEEPISKHARGIFPAILGEYA